MTSGRPSGSNFLPNKSVREEGEAAADLLGTSADGVGPEQNARVRRSGAGSKEAE